VLAENTAGGIGVHGAGHGPGASVMGINDAPLPGGNGGWFESVQGEGVRGQSQNANHGGGVGVNTTAGIGVTTAHLPGSRTPAPTSERIDR
jgi:hypothetical protein